MKLNSKQKICLSIATASMFLVLGTAPEKITGDINNPVYSKDPMYIIVLWAVIFIAAVFLTYILRTKP